MKRILFGAFVGAMMLTSAAFAQETSGNFAGGSIMVGYDNRACSGILEGAIRYDSTTKVMEVCDGTSWEMWGG